MMGSNQRGQVSEAITGAVKQAGSLVTAALIISSVALLLAAVALIVSTRGRAT